MSLDEGSTPYATLDGVWDTMCRECLRSPYVVQVTLRGCLPSSSIMDGFVPSFLPVGRRQMKKKNADEDSSNQRMVFVTAHYVTIQVYKGRTMANRSQDRPAVRSRKLLEYFASKMQCYSFIHTSKPIQLHAPVTFDICQPCSRPDR